MTNSFTAVAKAFSNTLIFLLQKFELLMQKLLIFFSAKNINVFAIFQNRNLNVTHANNFVSFEQLGPEH